MVYKFGPKDNDAGDGDEDIVWVDEEGDALED